MVRKYAILIGATLALVLVDQLAKYVVLETLSTAFEGATSTSERLGRFFSAAPPPGESGYHFAPTAGVTVSESFFRFRYAENPGAAFGILRGVPPDIRGPLFQLITLGAVVFISLSYSRLKGTREERWASVGFMLVMGGALGNWVDRLARGFVIDFLEAHWFDKAYWPAFNIADSAICVGVACLLIDSFVRKEVPGAAATPVLKES